MDLIDECGPISHSTQQARLASYQRDHRLASLAFLDPDFVLTSDWPTLFAAAVDAAVGPLGADMGNVQLVDPVCGALRLVAHCWFAPLSGVLCVGARRSHRLRAGLAASHAGPL